MAEITKQVIVGDYQFELTLKSKSVHAHSLMTDCKINLNIKVNTLSMELEESLKPFIKDHKETKKL